LFPKAFARRSYIDLTVNMTSIIHPSDTLF
jgi:hypothetical protein